jgi:hypothetical protein
MATFISRSVLSVAQSIVLFGCLGFDSNIIQSHATIVTVSAIQDAYAGSSGTLYNDGELDVGYRQFVDGSVSYRSAIRFDLPASLSGKVIQSATLKLYYFDAWESFSPQAVHVHRATQSWTEDAFPSDLSYDPGSVESLVGGSGTEFRWINWDVTSIVRLWVNNSASNFGLILASSGASNTVRFISRESEAQAFQPLLEIQYLDQAPLQFTGTASYRIEPAESSAAGAKWRLAGGEWLNSGEVATDIPVGNSTVDFKPVNGWTPPPSFTVRIIGDHLASGVGTYNRTPDLNIGEIPEVRVYGGASVEFHVHSDTLGPAATLTMTDETNGRGGATFDSSSQVFRFTPTGDGKQRFNVTFNASAGTNEFSQIVPIERIPVLPPERSVFRASPTHSFPSEDSKDYIVVNTILSESTEPWNNQSRTTRSVTISGKTIVFQKGHANGLYESYNGSDDVKEMNIHAETVIIRDVLSLPETAVNIYSRELQFQGTAASIDTTPRSLVSRPPEFSSGAHGLKAGNITIQTERFISFPPGQTCFVMNGGDGQPGGLGRDGVVGQSKSLVDLASLEIYTCPWADHLTTFQLVSFDVFGGTLIRLYFPNQAFYNDPTAWQPGNGTDALPGGKPGNAGQAGNMFSSLDFANYTSKKGGRSGDGSANTGGAGGQPRPAYKGLLNGGWQIVSEFTSQPGKNVVSPSADITIGADGSVSKTGHSVSWISPYSLRMVLAHAKDAYLYGYPEEADSIFAEYEKLLTAYESFPEWQQLEDDRQFQFQEMLLEIRMLRHRISSHLDYFGNPAGWVPMLSFEANKAAYETEIDHAVRVLYLSYWIGAAANNLQKRVDALTTARGKTVEEIEQFKTLYGDATALIPVLQSESANIQQEENQRLQDIGFLEERLSARAHSNVEDRHKLPEWKKAAGILSTICMSVPVYQPVLGGVGAGLSILANSDPDNPFGTAISLLGAATNFNDKAFAASAVSWKTNLDGIKLSVVATNGLKRYVEYVRAMAPLTKPLGTNLAALQKYLKEAEIPKTELEAELARLKATSPEFQEIAAKLKDLAKRKDQFQHDLSQAVQSVTKLAADITHDLLAVDGMNRGIADGNRIVDQRVAIYLKEMDRRARERLLKYHYYVAKAYEYRLLRPYPGELNLTRLFDSMAAIAGTSSDGNLTAENFNSLKTVYEEELSTITSSIFQDYNSNRPELSAPVRFDLGPDELVRLNSGQSLTINMHSLGLFPQTEENLRIVKWRVANIQTHRTGTAFGRFAFMDLYMQHSGLSTLSRNGEFYLFRHYNNNTEQPIVWGARYDAIDNTVAPIEPSAASESLLRSLLGIASIPQTSENLLLYSRPSAWADVVLNKTVNTESGADIVIDSLRLEVQYDFTRKKVDQVGLEIASSNQDILPLFSLSSADLNHRQDALGELNRTYSKDTFLTLSAPNNYGEWRFQKWTDQSGNDLPGGPLTNSSVTLQLGKNLTLRAAYLSTSESPEVQLSLPVLSGGAISFFTPAQIGRTYALERSSDLINWSQVVQTNTLDPSVTFTVGASKSEVANFYRVKQAP